MNDSIFALIEGYLVFPEKSDSTGSHQINTIKSIPGVLDPNTAGYNQLIEFGFNRFQANNLINYRTKAGYFKNKTDLLKIYGIDTTFFKSIENYIQIEFVEEATKVSSSAVLVHVELNSADSTDLVQLNGIGPAFANRILKYRNLLGGFYSKTQILEVYNFPVETYQKIENSISADTLLIKKIRVNFAEFPDLIKHPYFSKKQAEAVLNFRNKNGSFQDILQLKSNGLIDPETFIKIRPYLTCR
jgi:DNA uptake protein ComE-like DNA-binding protein